MQIENFQNMSPHPHIHTQKTHADGINFNSDSNTAMQRRTPPQDTHPAPCQTGGGRFSCCHRSSFVPEMRMKIQQEFKFCGLVQDARGMGKMAWRENPAPLRKQ